MITLRGDESPFGIYHDDECIGFAYIDPDEDRRRSARVGFKLHSEHRGKGVGVAAAEACIVRAFGPPFSVRRVWVGVRSDTEAGRAAARVTEQLGFTPEYDDRLPPHWTTVVLNAADWRDRCKV